MLALGRVVLPLLAVLLAMVGCTTEPSVDPAAPSTTHSSAPEPERAIDQVPAGPATQTWSRQMVAVEQPEIAGDDVTIAVVRARGDEMDIVALDLSSGVELWRAPYLPPQDVYATWLGFSVFESSSGDAYVVFQRGVEGAEPATQAPYVAVDPRTGKVIARTRTVTSYWPAVRCADGKDVCLAIGPDRFAPKTRWDLDRFKLAAERPPRAVPEGAHIDDSGLVTSYDGEFEERRVGWFHEGRLQWLKSVQKFNRAKGEWIIGGNAGPIYYESADTLVLSFIRRPTPGMLRRHAEGEVVRDDMVTDHRQVGVDVSTGKVAWTRSGVGTDCVAGRSYELPVRCRWTGARMHRIGWTEPRPKGLTLTVEGYDAATGSSIWERALPNTTARHQIASETFVSQADLVERGEVRPIISKDGAELVALEDGSGRPAEDEVFLCSRGLEFDYSTDRQGPQYMGRDRVVLYPCSHREKPMKADPTAGGLVTALGVEESGVYVVALRGRLVAYELSD